MGKKGNHTGPGPISYSRYLGLDGLLNLQQPLSKLATSAPAHDEMLFIIVHQTYELWFKQILHELSSVKKVFNQPTVDEKKLTQSVSQLERINAIFELLTRQIDVLETMTPLDFLDFRDALYPASGLQSTQYRLVELSLGLPVELALPLISRLPPEEQERAHLAAQETSLFKLTEQWLERTPFMEFKGFRFWDAYRKAVESMLTQDRQAIVQHPYLNDIQQVEQLAELQKTEETFQTLFDENAHRRLYQEGKRRLSLKAIQAALLILLYRDEPLLHQPYRYLTALIDLDELLSHWRHRHALMAQRMIGSKIGTGGTSGHQYLRQAVEKHKIFSDISLLSTFLIPTSKRPALPKQLEHALGFSA